MDTESFLFIGVVCFLPAAAKSLLPVPEVRSLNYILSRSNAVTDNRDMDFSNKEADMLRRTVK